VIAIGRLTKPHGLQGEMVFLPYVYDMELLPELTHRKVALRQNNVWIEDHVVVAWRRSHKRVLMQFDGIHDLARAETLRECEVYIPRKSFPPLPEGDYYWFDIEGLTVFADDGRVLGTLTEIIYTGSNDVYVVQNDSQEYLIPALKDVVRHIDLKRGEIHLHPVPELLG
jgi:16S rRNA processing protein RimM